VAVGGKLHRDTGFNPGVLEELAQARWHRVPCFVIGAFGGVAGQLERQMIEEFSGANLLETGAEPEDFAMWTDTMDEYVGKLLVHLVRHTDEFRRRERVRHTLSTFQFSREGVSSEKLVNIAGVLHVDYGLVEKSSARFGSLMNAVEKADIDWARAILRNTQL